MARPRSTSRFPLLIAAATKVFLEKGYRRAQISHIAREMGVAPGTIYLYVETKEALFDLALRASLDPSAAATPALPVPERRPEEILRFIESELAGESRIESLERALKARRPKHSRSELERIVREIYGKLSRRWLALKLVERSALDWPELAALWFGGHRLRIFEQLARYLRMRMEANRLRPAPDAGAAARVILELAAAFAMHCRTEPIETQLSQTIAETAVVDAVLHAYARPRKDRR